MANMTDIITKSEELNNDLTQVKKELKRIASIKCRLKKMPGRKNYEEEMTKVLQEEQLIKNVRDYLAEPKKNVNNLTPEDVEKMDYDEVCKAIHSIQSKKTHTKWADDCEKDDKGLYVPGTGASYKEACRIEAMLIERRNAIKPVNAGHIRKTDLLVLLENIALAGDIDVKTCIQRIKDFVEEK